MVKKKIRKSRHNWVLTYEKGENEKQTLWVSFSRIITYELLLDHGREVLQEKEQVVFNKYSLNFHEIWALSNYMQYHLKC